MAEAHEVDVCVVGAGFAGLTAAWRLQQTGMSVAVLEARDRVGGRIWTQDRAGVPVDRGGAWLAPQHEAAFALSAEMGVGTYKTWVRGAHLLIGDGKARRYTGLIPKISPLAVLTIALAQLRINRMARKVPVDAPWEAAKAGQWDGQTVAELLGRTRIASAIGHDLFAMAVRGLFATELSEVSLLDLLFLVRAHRNIETLFSIEDGAQENLVQGGMGAIAAAVAGKLGDSLRLHTPVRAISHDDGGVAVTADGVVVRAGHAVVAVPPALALDIDFQPGLPEDRASLYRSAGAGIETKTLVVYDEPFWRDEGFSGQSAEPGSAAEVTIDASPSDGSHGVIASFTFGPVAKQFDALDAADRRRAVVGAMTARFGPRAAAPADFVDTAWWHEPWSKGCSMAHFPTGVLSRFGHLLRQPWGRLHWAGTETATVSHGAVDGAVRSGERAAAEILEARRA